MKKCPICGNETFERGIDADTLENTIICTLCREDFLYSDDYEEDGNVC